VTRLLLAETLVDADRSDEARTQADSAVRVFERLRAMRQLDRARAVLASLDG
jgi:hypothetical protein